MRRLALRIMAFSVFSTTARMANAMDVVGVFSFSSFKQVRSDIDQLGRMLPIPTSSIFDHAIQQATNGAGLSGLDKNRRWALLVTESGKSVLYVPVTSESGKLLRNLHRGGFARAVSQLGDTMVLDVNGEQVHVMRRGNYLLAADTDELLRTAVADPTPHLQKLSSKHDFAFRIDVDKLSSTAREELMSGFTKGLDTDSVPGGFERVEEAKLMANDVTTNFFQQAKSIVVAMNLDNKNGDITFDLELIGREGTLLEKASDWMHFRTQPVFRATPKRDVLASGGINVQLPGALFSNWAAKALKEIEDNKDLGETQKKFIQALFGQFQSGDIALEFAYTGGIADVSGAASMRVTPETLLQVESIAAASREDDTDEPKQFEVRGRKFNQTTSSADDVSESFSYWIGETNIIAASGPRHRQLLYDTVVDGKKTTKRPSVEININPGALRDSSSPSSPLNSIGMMMKGGNSNLSMYAWPTESGVRGKFKIEGGFLSKLVMLSIMQAATNGG